MYINSKRPSPKQQLTPFRLFAIVRLLVAKTSLLLFASLMHSKFHSTTTALYLYVNCQPRTIVHFSQMDFFLSKRIREAKSERAFSQVPRAISLSLARTSSFLKQSLRCLSSLGQCCFYGALPRHRGRLATGANEGSSSQIGGVSWNGVLCSTNVGLTRGTVCRGGGGLT